MSAGARPGESDMSARMRAGELALGVWLPLALAEIARYLAAWCGTERGVDAALESWGLGDLAAALRRDWEAGEDERQIEAIEELARIYGR